MRLSTHCNNALQQTATDCNICTYMKRDTETRCKIGSCWLVGARETLNSLQQCTATDCNRLQQTATDCNSLQQTTTRCNIWPHTATDCNRLQQTATAYNTLQHMATHCNILQHTATYCNRHTCRSESEKATLFSAMNTMKLTAERQKRKEKG